MSSELPGNYTAGTPSSVEPTAQQQSDALMGGDDLFQHPAQPVAYVAPSPSPFTPSSGQLMVGQAVGQQIWNQGEQYVNRWVNIDSLKYYFSVNNSYVLNKCRLLLFPFRHTGWVRLQRMGPSDDLAYQPPRDDINAPDMYIPLMSFVTWILVTSVMAGTKYQFTPEVFGAAMSTGLAVLVLEVLLLKTGFYLLSETATPPLLTLAALGGYKFLGVCLSMLTSLVMGSYGYYGVMVYTSVAMAVFFRGNLRVMWRTGASRSSAQRNYFIAAVMMLQLLWPLVLARG